MAQCARISGAGMNTTTHRSLVIRRIFFALLLAMVLAAIGYALMLNRPWIVPAEAKQRKNPLVASDAVLQSARAVYLDKCAHCHGDTGAGDGHDAALYDPRPSNFTDRAHMSTLTDGEIFYKITEGHKPMPSYKKRLTDEQRWQMVLFLRTFAASSGASPADEHSSSSNPVSGNQR